MFTFYELSTSQQIGLLVYYILKVTIHAIPFFSKISRQLPLCWIVREVYDLYSKRKNMLACELILYECDGVTVRQTMRRWEWETRPFPLVIGERAGVYAGSQKIRVG